MKLDLASGFHLTEIRRSDQDALIEFLNDKDVNATTVRIPFPYTAAAADDWFATVDTLTQQHGQPVCWAIRNAAGKLIGDIGFERGGGDQLHRAEIGYWLAKPFWGQGIMTAAVQTVCRHAFENLGLARIAAHVFHFNRASARVLEKCGFQREGHLVNHYLKHGKFIDATAYGLVK